MKSQLLLSAITALGAGAVGAVVVASGVATPPGAPADLSAQLVNLEVALDAVKADNQRLLDRLLTLENRPAALQPMRVDAQEPSTAEIDAIQADLSQLAAAIRDPEATLPPNMRQQISNVLEEIRAEEERVRDQEREKREREREEERFQEMVKELNLNAYQANELRQTVADAREKLDAAREALRETRDFEQMRGLFDTIRAETKTDLVRYMSNEQIATMEERYMNGRNNILGGFGGGRAGFGGGGGRGGRGGGF